MNPMLILNNVMHHLGEMMCAEIGDTGYLEDALGAVARCYERVWNMDHYLAMTPKARSLPEETWTWIEEPGLLQIDGRDCQIWITPRPSYCDRGNYLAHIDLKRGGDWKRLNLDAADGWPRYYFDLDRAKLELQAWLTKRKQSI